MLYSDFEAILDGMVGIPEYAGKSMRGAYCLANGKLQVVAAVLLDVNLPAMDRDSSMGRCCCRCRRRRCRRALRHSWPSR